MEIISEIDHEQEAAVESDDCDAQANDKWLKNAYAGLNKCSKRNTRLNSYDYGFENLPPEVLHGIGNGVATVRRKPEWKSSENISVNAKKPRLSTKKTKKTSVFNVKSKNQNVSYKNCGSEVVWVETDAVEIDKIRHTITTGNNNCTIVAKPIEKVVFK